MTATTSAATVGATYSGASAAPRAVRVLRLHLTNKWTTIGTPLLILTGIWAVNYVIWLLIWNGLSAENRVHGMDGTQYSGAVFYVFIYMLIVGVQAIIRTFPFALGFSVTRRDFFLGSALLFVGLSLLYSLILTAASYLEEATGGWGVGGHMFATVWYGTGDFLPRFAQLFFGLLYFFFVGAAVATVYLRWRANGMIFFWAGLVVVLLAIASLVTLTGSWGPVGTWFLDTGAFGLTAWSLIVTALAALFAFRVLRRATPKS